MTQDAEIIDPRIGQVIGSKYRVVRLLGQGGMGRVYEAQHTVIGRRFAIKCLLPQHTQQAAMVARFQREAEAAGSIENENIAAVLDFGTLEEGAPYLVMEYLEGEDLGQLLRRLGPLAVPRAAAIGSQACRGLAAAHARDIVHRDLKPENLFVCRRNDGSDLIKILDFGIAKLHAPVTLTNTGASMGTPSYMSVEQARGAKNVDQRADIYALGVILYEILAGQRPHPGDSYNEILYHVITEKPTPLLSLRPTMPAELAQIIERAMAREANDRYVSATDLADALAPFASGVVTPARLPIHSEQVPAVTQPSPASLPKIAVASSQHVTPLASSNRFEFARILQVCALLAIAGLAFLLWRARTDTGLGLRAGVPTEPSHGSAVSSLPQPLTISSSATVAPSTSTLRPRTEDPSKSESPGGRPPGQSASPEPVAAPSQVSTLARKKTADSQLPTVTKSRPFDRNNPYAN